MATASELLLEQEEPHFIISEDLRTVTIPYGQNVIGVFSDENVRRIWFDMPDTCDGTDLSDFQISINYINALKESGRYYVTDSTVADGTITFSWLVSRAVCASEGKVQFVVCLRLFDTDNETILKEFNTTITTMNVLVGIEAELELTDPQQDAVNSVIGPAIVATNDANAAAQHAEGAADDAEEATTAAVEATETATELIAAMVNINERAIPLMSETVRGGAKLGSGLDIVNGALTLAGGDIAGAVDDWLDDHPEATTTVEDGSITEVKLQEDFKALLAHVDGYHQLLGAGTSDALMSTDGEVATFMQRMSGHDGACKITSLRGNTVRWNQLVSEPNDATNWRKTVGTTNVTIEVENKALKITVGDVSSGGNSFVVSASLGANYISGHKYMLKAHTSSTNILSHWNLLDVWAGSTGILPNTQGVQSIIATATATSANSPYAAITFMPQSAPAQSAGTVIYIYSISCIDLTAMFGAGNEPATVEEFEALFQDAYYPYDAGSLLPVNVEGVQSVGLNQWDEEWEIGSYNSSGNKVASNNTIRSVNKFQIAPNTTYYAMFPSGTAISRACYYDDSGAHISGKDVGIPTPSTFTTPTNAHYMAFVMNANYGAVYNHDICINISDSALNGTYRPYAEQTREIPASTYFPDGLRSAGSVYDELTKSEAITRVGAVLLNGSEAWIRGTAAYDGETCTDRFVNISDAADAATVAQRTKCASDKFTPSSDTIWSSPDSNPWRCLTNGKQLHCVFVNTEVGITSAMTYTERTDAIKQWLASNNVTAYYELATPTITVIEPPLNMTYPVEQGGTESIVVPTGEMSAPPTMAIVYAYNADGVRDISQAIIAPIEGAKASASYAIGSYLVYAGILYRVTSAISVGGAIAPGTNCVQTTVMAELVRLTS